MHRAFDPKFNQICAEQGLQKINTKLKKVYGVPSLAAARKAFEQFCQAWSQYLGA